MFSLLYGFPISIPILGPLKYLIILIFRQVSISKEKQDLFSIFFAVILIIIIKCELSLRIFPCIYMWVNILSFLLFCICNSSYSLFRHPHFLNTVLFKFCVIIRHPLTLYSIISEGPCPICL